MRYCRRYTPRLYLFDMSFLLYDARFQRMALIYFDSFYFQILPSAATIFSSRRQIFASQRAAAAGYGLLLLLLLSEQRGDAPRALLCCCIFAASMQVALLPPQILRRLTRQRAIRRRDAARYARHHAMIYERRDVLLPFFVCRYYAKYGSALRRYAAPFFTPPGATLSLRHSRSPPTLRAITPPY